MNIKKSHTKSIGYKAKSYNSKGIHEQNRMNQLTCSFRTRHDLSILINRSQNVVQPASKTYMYIHMCTCTVHKRYSHEMEV